jgi:thiosulfate/3-mercaptopyruvate sulfurtransferase
MGSAWAARVWWLLRWIGFDRAAILDGGINAWKAEGRPLSAKPAVPAAKQLSAKLRPGLIAYEDEVRQAVNNDGFKLIDAMPESHYRGELVMYDWPGHIPGAINVPSFSLLDETGHYRPLDELAEMLGSDHDLRTITYCGGGISAASDAFILTRLGFTNVAVYDGSLQEWTQNPDNPLEVD